MDGDLDLVSGKEGWTADDDVCVDGAGEEGWCRGDDGGEGREGEDGGWMHGISVF